MLNVLNLYSGLIQSVIALTSVIVTIVYVIYTSKMVSTMNDQVNSGILPIIVANRFSFRTQESNPDPKKVGLVCVMCEIINFGRGPAKNIVVSFSDHETGMSIANSDHKLDIISEAGPVVEHVHFSKNNLSNIRFKDEGENMLASVMARIEYEDFVGNSYCTTRLFKLDKSTFRLKSVLGTFKFSKIKKHKIYNPFNKITKLKAPLRK